MPYSIQASSSQLQSISYLFWNGGKLRIDSKISFSKQCGKNLGINKSRFHLGPFWLKWRFNLYRSFGKLDALPSDGYQNFWIWSKVTPLLNMVSNPTSLKKFSLKPVILQKTWQQWTIFRLTFSSGNSSTKDFNSSVVGRHVSCEGKMACPCAAVLVLPILRRRRSW